jgi:hypothetical protein
LIELRPAKTKARQVADSPNGCHWKGVAIHFAGLLAFVSTLRKRDVDIRVPVLLYPHHEAPKSLGLHKSNSVRCPLF